MSYFFNEGISFLRDFEKNLRGVADSAAKMIEKKENPDCDFRMAKKTALNMIDGIRVATDSVELVHFQSQKDRRNREAQEMDAEFKRDMIEEKRIHAAKKEKEAAARGMQEFLNKVYEDDPVLSRLAKPKKEEETERLHDTHCCRCQQPLKEEQLIYVRDVFNDEPGPRLRNWDPKKTPAPGALHYCAPCFKREKENAERSVRIMPDITCCHCYKPFDKGDVYYVHNPLHDDPGVGFRRRNWDPKETPETGDLLYCVECFTPEKVKKREKKAKT